MLNLDLSNKKALLFDCDGTLADTMDAHNKAYELAFALNNVPFDIEEHKKWAPYGGNVLITETVVKKGYSHVAHEIVRDKQQLLPFCLKKYMRPNKELIEFIRDHSDDLDIIVVSNGRRNSITEILHQLGIFYHLIGLIAKEDYDFAKPNPQPYIIAMQEYNLKPEDVIVFEDNEIGVEAAKAAGIKDIVEVKTNEF
jgi:HAD superfamily hydrolase (TIGR01509 family)